MEGLKLIIDQFPQLTSLQLKQLEMMKSLYVDWNTRLNLISRKDIDNFYVRHVAHSLCIAKWLSFMDGSAVMDLGTGGGFPGIPLAILNEGSAFTLVDSIGKKLRAVDDIAQSLGLTNITTLHGRAEDIDQKFDFITIRAVARVDKLLAWCQGKIRVTSRHSIKNGIIMLKGGLIQEELALAGVKHAQIVPLTQFFELPFFEEKYLVHIPFNHYAS